MKKTVKKLSAMALCTVFASMQIASASIDTGLNNAVINNYDGGYVGIDTETNKATIKFDGNTHLNWDTLNVGADETLNFNAVNGATGLTIVNTVNSGMTEVYGAINTNDGIAQLIISNPNGMLFDGATFTTAGELMLTTQPLDVKVLNGNVTYDAVSGSVATKDVTIKNGSVFNVGKDFYIYSPIIGVDTSTITAKNLKLITADGVHFLACNEAPNAERISAVKMKAISVNGNVIILSGKEIVEFLDGGTINGGLGIISDGNVSLNSGLEVDANGKVKFNYDHNGPKLTVKGNLLSHNDGRIAYLRNASVGGNLDMSNSGGFLEVSDVNVTGNATLKTTDDSNHGVRHFVHVVGDNTVGGNLTIESEDNIHLGGYKQNLEDIDKRGGLTVGGDLTAYSKDGSIAVTTDTSAKNIKLTSDKLNIISDGITKMKADTYEFKANHYIGGLDTQDKVIYTMEEYTPIAPDEVKFVNVVGGKINKLQTANGKDGARKGFAFVKSYGDMNIDNVDVYKAILSSDKDVTIGPNAHATQIRVDGETRNLKVEYPSRDYELKYMNIKDNQWTYIKPTEEITYDLTNAKGGYNDGVQTALNTHLVGPDAPVVPPVQPVNPPTDDNENVKIMKNFEKNPIASAIEAPEVYTPVAFAADLDDEIETGVRKNVDGSVTVVRPFTPVN